MNWYDESEIEAWQDEEEQILKAAIGAYLKAKMKAQAKPQEEPNA